MQPFLEKKNVPPYSMLADFYDGMMEHVDYRTWSSFIHQIFERYGSGISTVCEFACGTGNFAAAMAAFPYTMICSDRSETMIMTARKKPVAQSGKILFFTGDMLSFKPSVECEAALCLYDSVNYLMKAEDILNFFNHVSECTTGRGIFVFDVCTEKNSLDHFDQRYELDRTHHYKRRSYYDRISRTQFNEIEAEIDGTLFHETHQQRIYSLDEIHAIIRASPFTCVAQLANLGFMDGSEASERVHFVLRKKNYVAI